MKLAASFVAAAVFLIALPLQAQTFESFAWAAAEAYSRGDSPGGHGIAFVGTRVSDLPRGMQLELEINTDTARAGFDHLRLNEEWWAGATLEGQFQFANLLTDYHRRGILVADRGFSASRIGGVAHVSTRREEHLFVRFEAGVHRWLFDRFDTTSDSFLLPRNTTVLSPRLRITWWDVAPDPSFTDWHRPFWRFAGFGFGVAFGIDHRDATNSWGVSSTGRNAPAASSGVATQWVRWGIRFADDFRFELSEEAGVMTGADDVTRRQIGGLNPYVVRVAGAPWATHLADQWAALTLKQRWAATSNLELGVRADAAWTNDLDRTGDSPGGEMFGVGAEFDWRPASWQVDGYIGYSPDTGEWAASPQLSAYLGAGRSF